MFDGKWAKGRIHWLPWNMMWSHTSMQVCRSVFLKAEIYRLKKKKKSNFCNAQQTAITFPQEIITVNTFKANLSAKYAVQCKGNIVQIQVCTSISQNSIKILVWLIDLNREYSGLLVITLLYSWGERSPPLLASLRPSRGWLTGSIRKRRKSWKEIKKWISISFWAYLG